VDPYLFENFNTVDGDFLSAKFRAFKFPESTYVQFKGTVNVCLDKCRGVSSSGENQGPSPPYFIDGCEFPFMFVTWDFSG
jgi:hypothetical protein